MGEGSSQSKALPSVLKRWDSVLGTSKPSLFSEGESFRASSLAFRSQLHQLTKALGYDFDLK